MTTLKLTFCLAAMLSVSLTAQAQVIIADNYDVPGNGTGFALGSGVNSGINPPTTRLTGSEADNLRYIQTITGTSKAQTAYSITDGKLAVAAVANSGRWVYSADGTTPYDFGTALGSTTATPLTPIVYEITLSIANNAAGIQRTSFGIGTVEGDVTTFDFGIQLHRGVAGNDFYTFTKRIDTGSSGAGDQNSAIFTTTAATYGNEYNFLIRVTDAGAETTTYNSQVQVSFDGGNTFFYDTATDPSLTNGWRLDGAGRYFIWDTAANAAPTYDNFSVTVVPEPSTVALAGIGAVTMGWLLRRSRRNG